MPRITGLQVTAIKDLSRVSSPVLSTESSKDMQTLSTDLKTTGKKEFILQKDSKTAFHIHFNMEEPGNRDDLKTALYEQAQSNTHDEKIYDFLMNAFTTLALAAQPTTTPEESLDLGSELLDEYQDLKKSQEVSPIEVSSLPEVEKVSGGDEKKLEKISLEKMESIEIVESKSIKPPQELQETMDYTRKVIPFAGNIRQEILSTKGESLLRSEAQSTAMTTISLATDLEGRDLWRPREIYNSDKSLKLLKGNPNDHYSKSAFTDIFMHSTLAHKTGGGVCDDFSAVVFTDLLEHPPEGIKSMGRYSWEGTSKDIGHSFVIVDMEDGNSFVVDPWLSDKPLSKEKFTELMNDRGLKGKIGEVDQFVYHDKYTETAPKTFAPELLTKEVNQTHQNISGPWSDVLKAKQGISHLLSQMEAFQSIETSKGDWETLGFPPEELDEKAGRKIFGWE